MLLSQRIFGDWRRLLLLWLAASLLLSQGSAVYAQAVGASVRWKICERPPLCFLSVEARQDWAKEHDCQFLEDVCEKAPAADDNKGAKAEDQGFWGNLWSGVKGGLVYGYEFVKGLLSGLKDQVTGLLALLRNFDDVLSGLIQLGKSFYNDPKGTLRQLAEVLGQDVVDTLAKATQCGPYDLGKVIGQNVSPVLVAKLATKLSRYAGDLRRAVKATKHELGCASFAAGTPVWTPSGFIPIEQVATGHAVRSRNERGFAEADQRVTHTFDRTADQYHTLVTEFETFEVTDEHPLWLQGKGWTAVKELQRGDVVATVNGDVTILHNARIDRPLQVYNFSVASTSSYFVGGGVWAHNANCDLSSNYAKLTPKERGFRGELDAAAKLELKGYKRVGKTFDPSKYPDIDAAMKGWDGQTGIDGIFKNDKGEYVIIESKATGGTKRADPSDCVDKLCNTDSGRQMSEDWIRKNVDKIVPDKAEQKKLLDGLTDGTTKRVYAQTDSNGTIFNEILTPTGKGSESAIIGGSWSP